MGSNCHNQKASLPEKFRITRRIARIAKPVLTACCFGALRIPQFTLPQKWASQPGSSLGLDLHGLFNGDITTTSSTHDSHVLPAFSSSRFGIVTPDQSRRTIAAPLPAIASTSNLFCAHVHKLKPSTSTDGACRDFIIPCTHFESRTAKLAFMAYQSAKIMFCRRSPHRDSAEPRLGNPVGQ